MGSSFIPIRVSKRLWKNKTLIAEELYISMDLFIPICEVFSSSNIISHSSHGWGTKQETSCKAEILHSSHSLSRAGLTSCQSDKLECPGLQCQPILHPFWFFTLNLGSSWAGNMKLSKWRHEFLMDLSEGNQQTHGHMEQSISLFYKASCSFTLCCTRKLKLHMVPVIWGLAANALHRTMMYVAFVYISKHFHRTRRLFSSGKLKIL